LPAAARFGLYEHSCGCSRRMQFSHGWSGPRVSHLTLRCRHGQQAVPVNMVGEQMLTGAVTLMGHDARATCFPTGTSLHSSTRTLPHETPVLVVHFPFPCLGGIKIWQPQWKPGSRSFRAACREHVPYRTFRFECMMRLASSGVSVSGLALVSDISAVKAATAPVVEA
jgi:hypothetical protein